MPLSKRCAKTLRFLILVAEPQVLIEQDRLKHTMDPAFHRNALINRRWIRCYLESYLAICDRKSGRSKGHLIY